MNCQLAELNEEALLHISGPDTLTFLQGQTTCDTRPVDAGRATPGAFCTPKGRVICDFLLARVGEEHFALRLRRDILHTAAEAFGKYIVFSRAQLAPASDHWAVYGCWGDDARDALLTALGAAPAGSSEGPWACCAGDGYQVVQTDEAGTAFECYLDRHGHPALAERLAALPSGDASAWRALQIEQGLARIEAPTVELFIPQALNYDLTGHVSFTKGCYTGQEVVARMHYRGKPKKRLFRATVATPEPPQAGTGLFANGATQAAGTVVNAAPAAGGCSHALIVAPLVQHAGELQLGAPGGPAVTYENSGFPQTLSG